MLLHRLNRLNMARTKGDAYVFVRMKTNDQLVPVKEIRHTICTSRSWQIITGTAGHVGCRSSGRPCSTIVVMEGIKNVAKGVRVIYARKGAIFRRLDTRFSSTNKLVLKCETGTRKCEIACDKKR